VREKLTGQVLLQGSRVRGSMKESKPQRKKRRERSRHLHRTGKKAEGGKKKNDAVILWCRFLGSGRGGTRKTPIKKQSEIGGGKSGRLRESHLRHAERHAASIEKKREFEHRDEEKEANQEVPIPPIGKSKRGTVI